MCCGSKRAAFRNMSTRSRAPSAAPVASQGESETVHIQGAPGWDAAAMTAAVSVRGSSLSVLLHYMETSAIRVRGPVTGRPYEFSGARPAQAVDPRDAAVLTRTGRFRRA
jgi:hypothetical protein